MARAMQYLKPFFGTRRASFAAALVLTLFSSLAAVHESYGQGQAPLAERIVSIGGSVTEILYALGAEDRVVAVDTTSVYPSEAAEKPDVGYMRALSAEGVLSVDPDLILSIEGAGPATAVDVLKSASVPLIEVADVTSPRGVVEKIRAVGEAVGEEAAAAQLAARVEEEFAALKSFTENLDEKKRVLFLLSFNGGRPIAAGEGTSAEAIIQLAGGRNALTGFEGFKPVSDEMILNAAPDAVLIMNRGSHKLTAEEVFSKPAFKLTPAAQTRSLISMDGLYLLGFGPRTASAARELAQSLYAPQTYAPQTYAPQTTEN